MKTKLLSISLAVATLCSCGGGNSNTGLADGASGNMEAYESSDVNAIVQAKPEIMVIPSDQTLKDAGCLKTKRFEGQKYEERDYTRFLTSDEYFKPLVADIQDRFISANYPLNDFEQTLKSIGNQDATNIADNVAQDAKTKLLQVATPDIILEFDYSIASDYTKSDRSQKSVKYIINGIDAYTNKVIATIHADGLTGSNGVAEMKSDFDKKMPRLMADIQNYFNDILTRGREITVRINVDSDSNQKLTDESIEGDTYADAVIDYIKTHTVKGAYKMQTNTADQLTFTGVRIKVLNDNGTQYGVYDWTRDLQKYLKRNLGLSTENRSQGLGEVVLTVKGM